MGEVLRGVMLCRKQHWDGSAHDSSHTHNRTQTHTSVKTVTAVTRANTAPLKYDRDVTVYSFPFRPSIN